MDKNIDFFSPSFIFESSLFTKHWTNIRKMKGHKIRQKQVSSCIVFFKKKWTWLKHEFFKLCFHQERLIAWVEPLSSGCSPSYFTIVCLMLNFWNSFLNDCTSGVTIFSDFGREVSKQPQLCWVLLCKAVSNSQFNGGSILSLLYSAGTVAFLQYRIQRGERCSKSTNWSQGKLRRHPKRAVWGQHKCPEALLSADGLYKLSSVCGGKWSWLEKGKN